MRPIIRHGLLALGLVGLAAAALLALGSAPASAQLPAGRLGEFIEQLDAKGAPFTVHFAAPLPGGDTFLALPDAGGKKLAEVGADYLCYSEPWNNRRRVRCTPFANILSLTYSQ